MLGSESGQSGSVPLSSAGYNDPGLDRDLVNGLMDFSLTVN